MRKFFQLIPLENQLLVSFRRLLRHTGFLNFIGRRLSRDRSTVSEAKAKDPLGPTHLVCLSQELSLTMHGFDSSQLRLKISQDRHILEAIYASLMEGDVFWDIGANIGVYTVVMALASAGKNVSVVAFEPEAASYNVLRRNLDLNRITRAKAVPLALGELKEDKTLYFSKDPAAGTHSLLTARRHQMGDSQTIRVERGDSLIEKSGLPPPNVIKIDTEGTEYEVFEGLGDALSLPSCHTVVCEVHFSMLDSRTPQKIVNFLKARGFKTRRWLDLSHVYLSKKS